MTSRDQGHAAGYSSGHTDSEDSDQVANHVHDGTGYRQLGLVDLTLDLRLPPFEAVALDLRSVLPPGWKAPGDGMGAPGRTQAEDTEDKAGY